MTLESPALQYTMKNTLPNCDYGLNSSSLASGSIHLDAAGPASLGHGVTQSDVARNIESRAFGRAVDALPPSALDRTHTSGEALKAAFAGQLGAYKAISSDALNQLTDRLDRNPNGTFNGDFSRLQSDLQDLYRQMFMQNLQQAGWAGNGNNGAHGSGRAAAPAGSAGAAGAAAPAGGAGAPEAAAAGAGGADGSGAATGSATSTGSDGGDFFIALAKALGKIAQNQGQYLQQLSQKVDQAQQSQDPNLVQDQTLLNAESQKFAFLMQSIMSVINAIGEGLKTAARSPG